MSRKHKILFVCNRNVVQGPVMEMMFNQADLEINQIFQAESAGIQVQAEHLPSDYTKVQEILKKNDLDDTHTRRVMLTASQLDDYRIIYCSEKSVQTKVRELQKKNSKAKVKLITGHNPRVSIDIPDPALFTDATGYEKCFTLCKSNLHYIMDHLRDIASSLSPPMKKRKLPSVEDNFSLHPRVSKQLDLDHVQKPESIFSPGVLSESCLKTFNLEPPQDECIDLSDEYRNSRILKKKFTDLDPLKIICSVFTSCPEYPLKRHSFLLDFLRSPPFTDLEDTVNLPQRTRKTVEALIDTTLEVLEPLKVKEFNGTRIKFRVEDCPCIDAQDTINLKEHRVSEVKATTVVNVTSLFHVPNKTPKDIIFLIFNNSNISIFMEPQINDSDEDSKSPIDFMEYIPYEDLDILDDWKERRDFVKVFLDLNISLIYYEITIIPEVKKPLMQFMKQPLPLIDISDHYVISRTVHCHEEEFVNTFVFVTFEDMKEFNISPKSFLTLSIPSPPLLDVPDIDNNCNSLSKTFFDFSEVVIFVTELTGIEIVPMISFSLDSPQVTDIDLIDKTVSALDFKRTLTDIQVADILMIEPGFTMEHINNYRIIELEPQTCDEIDLQDEMITLVNSNKHWNMIEEGILCSPNNIGIEFDIKIQFSSGAPQFIDVDIVDSAIHHNKSKSKVWSDLDFIIRFDQQDSKDNACQVMIVFPQVSNCFDIKKSAKKIDIRNKRHLLEAPQQADVDLPDKVNAVPPNHVLHTNDLMVLDPSKMIFMLPGGIDYASRLYIPTNNKLKLEKENHSSTSISFTYIESPQFVDVDLTDFGIYLQPLNPKLWNEVDTILFFYETQPVIEFNMSYVFLEPPYFEDVDNLHPNEIVNHDFASFEQCKTTENRVSDKQRGIEKNYVKFKSRDQDQETFYTANQNQLSFEYLPRNNKESNSEKNKNNAKLNEGISNETMGNTDRVLNSWSSPTDAKVDDSQIPKKKIGKEEKTYNATDVSLQCVKKRFFTDLLDDSKISNSYLSKLEEDNISSIKKTFQNESEIDSKCTDDVDGMVYTEFIPGCEDPDMRRIFYTKLTNLTPPTTYKDELVSESPPTKFQKNATSKFLHKSSPKTNAYISGTENLKQNKDVNILGKPNLEMALSQNSNEFHAKSKSFNDTGLSQKKKANNHIQEFKGNDKISYYTNFTSKNKSDEHPQAADTEIEDSITVHASRIKEHKLSITQARKDEHKSDTSDNVHPNSGNNLPVIDDKHDYSTKRKDSCLPLRPCRKYGKNIHNDFTSGNKDSQWCTAKMQKSFVPLEYKLESKPSIDYQKKGNHKNKKTSVKEFNDHEQKSSGSEEYSTCKEMSEDDSYVQTSGYFPSTFSDALMSTDSEDSRDFYDSETNMGSHSESWARDHNSFSFAPVCSTKNVEHKKGLNYAVSKSYVGNRRQDQYENTSNDNISACESNECDYNLSNKIHVKANQIDHYITERQMLPTHLSHLTTEELTLQKIKHNSSCTNHKKNLDDEIMNKQKPPKKPSVKGDLFDDIRISLSKISFR